MKRKFLAGRVLAVSLAVVVAANGASASAMAASTDDVTQNNAEVSPSDEMGTNEDITGENTTDISVEQPDLNVESEQPAESTEENVSEDNGQDTPEVLDIPELKPEDETQTENLSDEQQGDNSQNQDVTNSTEQKTENPSQAPVKDKALIKFDKRLDYVFYDGVAHSLTAGVYDSTGERFAEASLTYTGVEADGTVYQSKEAPVNAGAYQVTATFFGDEAHMMAPIDVLATLVIIPAAEAVVQIHDVTTESGDTTSIEYTYDTIGVADRDINSILSSIYCESDHVTDDAHVINGIVNKMVAKNYRKVTVIPGTHNIIPRKVVNVTIFTDETQGTFPYEESNLISLQLPVVEGGVTELPEAVSNEGYEFIGWTVNGKDVITLPADAAEVAYVDLAYFEEGSNEGYLTVEATYNSVEPEKPDPEKPVTPEDPDPEKPVTPEKPDSENPVTPEDPDEDNDKEKDKDPVKPKTEKKSVKTADNSPVAVYMTLFVATIVAFVSVCFRRKRQ